MSPILSYTYRTRDSRGYPDLGFSACLAENPGSGILFTCSRMTEQSVAPFIHGLYGRGARRRALFMLYRSLRYEPDEPVDGVVFLPLIARNRPRVPVGLPLSETFVDGTEVPGAAVF